MLRSLLGLVLSWSLVTLGRRADALSNPVEKAHSRVMTVGLLRLTQYEPSETLNDMSLWILLIFTGRPGLRLRLRTCVTFASSS
jgi:hypothetical protein